MSERLPVAVDAMGSDGGPAVIIEGARRAAETDGIGVVLVGDPDRMGDTVAHRLGGPYHRRILHRSDARGRFGAHFDHLGCRDHRQGAGVAHPVGIADQHDTDAVGLGGPAGAFDDDGGPAVGAHGVDGDRQALAHVGPNFCRLISRRRPL
ncbi:MAG: hypothetical protein AAFN30_00985, partial [Actinomycetota bacterium]